LTFRSYIALYPGERRLLFGDTTRMYYGALLVLLRMLISSWRLYMVDGRVNHLPLSFYMSLEHPRRPIVSVMRSSADTNVVRSR
jgi:hypothetical protein